MDDNNTIYPVLPLRDVVVFPHMVIPLFVGREKSIRALDEVMAQQKQVFLATQKNPLTDDPDTGDIYDVGVVSNILQMLKLPDGTVKVLAEGVRRAKVTAYFECKEFFEANVESLGDSNDNSDEIEALRRAVVSHFDQYVRLGRKIPSEVLTSVSRIENPSKLADTIASHLALSIPKKQELLENESVYARLEKIFAFMENEITLLQVEKKVRKRVKSQMDKTQREYYLNEQMKAIQKELGEIEDGKDEFSELKEKIEKTKFGKEIREKALGELKKLRTMGPMSAEANVVRNYLDWLLSIPWNKRSRCRHDLNQSQKILDQDHFGLEKVKERIIEYLAVQARIRKLKGPILCLVGPPGVGKTSLGRSIARATGRQFVRVSLGGVRDESEIRGHRRTYVGSLPGKIIQGMKKAKVSNPLFLLDEIDKLGTDWRGDPTSALLEVLDPEQNNTFNDHYLEVDYDLSDVMFVTTANNLNMPQPLLDRLEIIRIPGYTEEEKIEIALRHLLPKQIKNHGLKKGEWIIPRSIIRHLVRFYTREAGVRNLEREIANISRKIVREIMMDGKEKISITPRNLSRLAGVRRFRYGKAEKEAQIGITTGLAWTQTGGELLSVEAAIMPGKGKCAHTGKLGDVMKESVQAAISYVRSRSMVFGIKQDIFEKTDIHVHVPEGATPKDGPSAGIAMCTSIISALTRTPVNKNIAMTGEITLSGRVLPIGGLREKLLAALRGGIRKVLIPEENSKDLAEMSKDVKNKLEIVPVKHVDEVIPIALTGALTPIDWKGRDIIPPTPAGKEEIVAH